MRRCEFVFAYTFLCVELCGGQSQVDTNAVNTDLCTYICMSMVYALYSPRVHIYF